MKLTYLLALILSTSVFAQFQYDAVLAFEAGKANISFNHNRGEIAISLNKGMENFSLYEVDCEDLPSEDCYEVFRESKLHLERIKEMNKTEKVALTFLVNIDSDDYEKEKLVLDSQRSMFKVVNEQIYQLSNKLENANLLLSDANQKIVEERVKMDFVIQVIKNVGKRKAKKILQAIKDAGYEI